MIIMIYSEMTERSVTKRLGDAEYSYYFVLKEFRPILEQLGRVIVIDDPSREVDPIYRDATERGEPCIFLSFSAPHRTPLGLACPTIPVLAWEFGSIPDEAWFHEPEQDWRFALNKFGRAITHSTHAARVVQNQMGGDFPVANIPAPVWDRFAPFYDKSSKTPPAAASTISLAAKVYDTRASWPFSDLPGKRCRILLEGVVYLSIFNPKDGRKNVFDMVSAFCRAFADVRDATLILKLVSSDFRTGMSELRKHLDKLKPFKCRVLLLAGFLGAEDYEMLIGSATYAVNSSHGEGQCLPLMELMSCGKPAIAPDHTGMVDYVDSENAFLVKWTAEPASWPQDPRSALRTLRQRIDFESLVKAYRESYQVAREDHARYFRMGRKAHEALRRHCSHEVARARLCAFFELDARVPEIGGSFGKIARRPDAAWIDAMPPGSYILLCGSDFDSVALYFANRGSRIDVMGGSRELRDAAKTQSLTSGITFLERSGDFDITPGVLYDLVLLDHAHTRQLNDTQILSLRQILAPSGKILAAAPPDPENSLWRQFAGLFKSPFEEDKLARSFRKAGFLRRRYLFRFDTYVTAVSEFELWTRPLSLSDCFLAPQEELSWHGREDHGRWTRAESFLDLPFRDGQIEIVARNLRHSKCAGHVALGESTQPFEVEAGAALSVRLPQFAAKGDQRLVFASDVAIGGPNDPRELGIAVESIIPL